jgi:hypothetical protein
MSELGSRWTRLRFTRRGQAWGGEAVVMQNEVETELDRTQVSLDDQDLVGYWTRRFGVTPEHLERAVKAVGNDARDVERELDSHRFDRYLYEGCA